MKAKKLKNRIRLIKYFIDTVWISETDVLAQAYELLGGLEDDLSKAILEDWEAEKNAVKTDSSK
ncbi:MAG: hypothetical protein ABF624_00230 [Liquorilactobacillus ghanensis]|uniref:hypothetical protein n=1 Tax=Liquorilactobacillus ghanensis TaxID=399370 RepID=UPI0039EA00B5